MNVQLLGQPLVQGVGGGQLPVPDSPREKAKQMFLYMCHKVSVFVHWFLSRLFGGATPTNQELEKLFNLDQGSKLCYDAMGVIFSYDMRMTFSLAQVSTTWHNFVKEFYISRMQKNCLTIEELFIYHSRLSFRESFSMKSNDWNNVFMHCKQLGTLKFSGDFLKLGSSSGRFGLPDLERQDKRIQEIGSIFQAVAKTNFEVLDFSDCEGLGIYEKFTKPEEIGPNRFFQLFRYVRYYCANTQSKLVAQQVWQALDHVPNVTHLNLVGCSAWLDLIHAFVEKLPNLVSLDFDTVNYNLQDMLENKRCVEIAKIGEHCPKLERLKIDGLGGNAYEAEDIEILAEKFPCLTHLSIDAQVVSDGWIVLAEKCQALVSLQFTIHCKEYFQNEERRTERENWQQKLRSFKETHSKIAISPLWFPNKHASIFLKKDAENVRDISAIDIDSFFD